MFLCCELCREPIAMFNPERLTWPLDVSVFRSIYPERSIPDPFPPGTDWESARCPRCRRRPFFNHTDRNGDGLTWITTDGEAVCGDDRWFVMVLGDSGRPEKMLCCIPSQPVTPPEPPSDSGDDKQQQQEDDGEEAPAVGATGNYKSPPAACPVCGKVFRSAGRLSKFHTPCPEASKPPQEGFKI